MTSIVVLTVDQTGCLGAAEQPTDCCNIVILQGESGHHGRLEQTLAASSIKVSAFGRAPASKHLTENRLDGEYRTNVYALEVEARSSGSWPEQLAMVGSAPRSNNNETALVWL